MEKNQKYILQKKEYNSKLSTFQISKEIHKKVKEYLNNFLKVTTLKKSYKLSKVMKQ